MDGPDLTNRVALVTGGSGGIGAALSERLAAAGAAVAVHYSANRGAAERAGDGVTVNAIAPALIEDTGMLPGDPGELAARVPVGRLGTPAEVADLALAILANGYVTNQVIGVDGGLHPR